MPSSLCRLQDQVNTLRYGVVTVRSGSGVTRSYRAAADSGTARMAALREAMASTRNGDIVTLHKGDFTIADGAPISSFLPSGVTKVKVFCDTQASHEYVDPEEAAADYSLFTFPKAIVDFGLRELTAAGAIQDNWKPLQAAANSLPPRADVLYLESGRRLKNGAALDFPVGIYYTSKQWEVSPCTVIKGINEGTINSVLRPIANSFTAGQYLIKMENPAGASFSRNNCFGARLTNIRLDQVTRDANPGLNGLYWYGAQLTDIFGVSINNFKGYGAVLYGCTYDQLWITNCYLTGLIWTGGGNCGLLSIERCNPDQIVDPATTRQYPWIEVTDGTFNFDFIQSEDSPPLTNNVTLLWAHDVTGLTVDTMYMGSNGADVRTHTMVLLTATCHNVNLQAILCFPGTLQTLVNDLSQNSPNGAGVQYLLTGNTGQYANGVVAQNRTWTGFNQFKNQTYFGNGAAATSQVFLSPNGSIDLGDGKIDGTRSTFYINVAAPKPFNLNNGAFTVTAAGIVDVLGEYRVDGLKVVGNRAAAIADATGGATVDAEARTALNDLLAKLRIHGIIAT